MPRRIRVLPRRGYPAWKGERTLPEPPRREPARQISAVLPLHRRGGPPPLPTLLAMQPLRAAGHEVILVHDGVAAEVIELVGELVDQIVEGPDSVAQRLNLGARFAWGEQLLFLRVGCLLPERADGAILEALEEGISQWGCFATRFSGNRFYSWFAGQPANWRSRLLGIVAAEQGLFVRRSLFDRAGGFPDVSSRENEALSKVLRRSGPPAFIRLPLIVTARERSNVPSAGK